jgi:hypothetical protein
MIDRPGGREYRVRAVVREPIVTMPPYTPMRSTIMDPIITDIDERWMAEWVTFGMRELESYLGKHRCFEEYYSRRKRSLGPPALDR